MTAAQKRDWLSVQESAIVTRCKCVLQPAMSRSALVALGGGCKMPSYACPTLDKYRRLTPPDRVVAPPTDEPPAPRFDPFATQIRRTP